MGTHDSRSLAGLSEFSEQCDSIEDLSMEGNQLQEQISNLVVDGARGPVRMEMQLRYLLELTLEGNVTLITQNICFGLTLHLIVIIMFHIYKKYLRTLSSSSKACR